MSQHRRLRAIRFAFGLTVIGLYGPAFAQDAGDPGRGRQLAEMWCASCHIVSPTDRQGSSNGAPPFAAVARMPSTTTMSLHAFLQTPHPPMPDLQLNAYQLDDIAAYILSLRRK